MAEWFRLRASQEIAVICQLELSSEGLTEAGVSSSKAGNSWLASWCRPLVGSLSSPCASLHGATGMSSW